MRGHRVHAVAIQRRQGNEDDVEPLPRQPEPGGDDEEAEEPCQVKDRREQGVERNSPARPQQEFPLLGKPQGVPARARGVPQVAIGR